ncbi:biotin-dependent carboxyltransferase family protein [Nocardia sp. NPDC050630]|uniref:biotin-dependent carboxyltransferase family protein n=1 Tax=Nocardia sp. NPDC050630 TaxID=3364321 RepID=UPI0037B3D305
MTTATITVLQAGHAVVQDLGRPGFGRVSLIVNGASDQHSAVVANTLVGNTATAPLLEVTGSALGLHCSAPVLVAATGAVDHILVDGVPQPASEPLVVGVGQQFTMPSPTAGLRSYLAVNGWLASEPVLGSVAPDPLLGVGRRLHAGDKLVIESAFESLDHPYSRLPLFRLCAPQQAYSHSAVIDMTAGPEAGQFASGIVGSNWTYTVSPQSDHVGLRLRGATPARVVREEMISRGVPIGAIEVPPGGGLLVLLRGRLLVAGYPVIGVASTTAVDRLAQLAPGDSVAFRLSDVTDAVRAVRARDRALRALAERVSVVFRSTGLGHIVHAGHLSRVSDGIGCRHINGGDVE